MGADVPEDVPQGVKTDPQGENEDAEAQGPEHDAYLEQVTCLR